MAKPLSKSEKVVNKICNMKRERLVHLATAAGLSTALLINIKAGRNNRPSADTVDRLWNALGY